MVRRERPAVDPDEAYERFGYEYEKLQFESERLASIERTPENFEKLAAGHLRVSDIQNRATDAKRDIHTRYEGKGSDWVQGHPGGPGDTSRAGKIGVLFGAAVMLILGGIGSFFVYNNWPRAGIDVVEVINEQVGVETRGSGEFCVWQFDVIVENTSESVVQVTGSPIVVERRRVSPVRQEAIEVAPSQSVTVPLVVTLGLLDSAELNGSCPAAGDIDHGPIRIATDAGREASAEF